MKQTAVEWLEDNGSGICVRAVIEAQKIVKQLKQNKDEKVN